jgi:hypothetical protein
VRDTVNMVRLGIPSIVFVHEPFEKLARAQMRQLGIEDSKTFVLVYPVDRPSADSAEVVREKAKDQVSRIPDLLTSQEWRPRGK